MVTQIGQTNERINNRTLIIQLAKLENTVYGKVQCVVVKYGALYGMVHANESQNKTHYGANFNNQ
jgi:hypothetical protein